MSLAKGPRPAEAVLEFRMIWKLEVTVLNNGAARKQTLAAVGGECRAAEAVQYPTTAVM